MNFFDLLLDGVLADAQQSRVLLRDAQGLKVEKLSFLLLLSLDVQKLRSDQLVLRITLLFPDFVFLQVVYFADNGLMPVELGVVFVHLLGLWIVRDPSLGSLLVVLDSADGFAAFVRVDFGPVIGVVKRTVLWQVLDCSGEEKFLLLALDGQLFLRCLQLLRYAIKSDNSSRHNPA